MCCSLDLCLTSSLLLDVLSLFCSWLHFSLSLDECVGICEDGWFSRNDQARLHVHNHYLRSSSSLDKIAYGPSSSWSNALCQVLYVFYIIHRITTFIICSRVFVYLSRNHTKFGWCCWFWLFCFCWNRCDDLSVWLFDPISYFGIQIQIIPAD